MKESPDRDGGGSVLSVREADRRPGRRAPTAPSVPAVDAAHSPTAPRWSLLALRPSSPFRPPDWRSRLAAEIAGHPDPQVSARLARWADARVLDLVRLGGQPPSGHPLAVARELLSPDRHRVLVEVEARLLAGQPDAAVAAATGVGADAVGWFHDAAFDCRPRLRHTSAVVHTFLGHAPEVDGPALPPRLVRWYAYFGGIHVLEQVLRLHDDPTPGPAAMVDRSAASLRKAADRAACRAAVLARLLPGDSECRTTGRRLVVLGAVGRHRASGRGLMGPLTPPDGRLPNPPAAASESGERMGKPVELAGEFIPAGSPAGATQRVSVTTGSAGVQRAARVHPLLEGRL